MNNNEFQRDTPMAHVLGNGPSLATVDLKTLNSSYSFGMNAAYRYWHTIGWFPKYYVCLDPVVLSSHRLEILKLVKASKINFFSRGIIL